MPILGLLALSDDPLYRTYELAPRIIPGFSAMDDQIFGGTMMEMSAAAVSVGLLGWSMWGWMKDDERRNGRPNQVPATKDVKLSDTLRSQRGPVGGESSPLCCSQ